MKKIQIKKMETQKMNNVDGKERNKTDVVEEMQIEKMDMRQIEIKQMQITNMQMKSVEIKKMEMSNMQMKRQR